MKNKSIPLEFASKKLSLNWSDYYWAYKNNFLTWRDLVAAAAQRVAAGSIEDMENELASVDKESVWRVSDLSERLSLKEGCLGEPSKRKWLFLSLAWLLEKNKEVNDPLERVEEIYADFEYPKEIESFVRFLPSSDGYDPALHSKEENLQRLMKNWQEYIVGYK